ncbi:hypothetical protein HBN50_02955 [Halobacteriovorax sp. GB3]|uniref:hypothetical protein n=1 Tax=Halobacteriovorax sp. GB3 TaxID=2719615 RepID=UPI00235F886E|nr:hypothetical protein [Halobacteriovorax sp. GB3]MDD0852034.1 hypothetical protein [Halobacteriovorax sp. GB3]
MKKVIICLSILFSFTSMAATRDCKEYAKTELLERLSKIEKQFDTQVEINEIIKNEIFEATDLNQHNKHEINSYAILSFKIREFIRIGYEANLKSERYLNQHLKSLTVGLTRLIDNCL